MTESFKQALEQVIALAQTLSVEEIEAIRSTLFTINYKRQDALTMQAKALLNA